LPDRNSLAVVIKNWLHSLKTVVAHGPVLPRRRADREPHIGEYGTKTNAICDLSQIPASVRDEAITASPRRCRKQEVLLPVSFQHPVAGCGNLGTILLEAGQNYEIALVYDWTAETLNIARAGFLLFRCATLLGDGCGRNRQRQQDKCQERFMHRVPSF
jgi:hypothetical protein